MTEGRFVVTRTDPLAEQPAPVPLGAYDTLAAARAAARDQADRSRGGDKAWVVTEPANPTFELAVRWDRETQRAGNIEPVADPGAELVTRHRAEHSMPSSMEWRRFLGDRELTDVAAATSARVEAWGGAEVPVDMFDEADTRRWLLDDGTRVEVSSDFRGISVAAVVVDPESEDPREIPILAMIVGRAIVRTGTA